MNTLTQRNDDEMNVNGGRWALSADREVPFDSAVYRAVAEISVGMVPAPIRISDRSANGE